MLGVLRRGMGGCTPERAPVLFYTSVRFHALCSFAIPHDKAQGEKEKYGNDGNHKRGKLTASLRCGSVSSVGYFWRVAWSAAFTPSLCRACIKMCLFEQRPIHAVIHR